MAIASEVTGAPKLGSKALRNLEVGIHGEVFRPGHPGYDPAPTLYSATIHRHPAVIVRCRKVSDVQDAIELARNHGLLVATCQRM